MSRPIYGADLLAFIESHCMPIPECGCWIWMRRLNDGGYGCLNRGGEDTLVHRITFKIRRGPIPEGKDLDHLCRVRSCCNPNHLEPVTRRVNLLRGMAPAAHNARKTHCSKGHPLAGENLDPSSLKLGRRRCLACRQLWIAQREQKAFEARRARGARAQTLTRPSLRVTFLGVRS